MPRPPELTGEELRLAQDNFRSGKHKPVDTALIILVARALKKPSAQVAEEWYELHRMVKKHLYNHPVAPETDAPMEG